LIIIKCPYQSIGSQFSKKPKQTLGTSNLLVHLSSGYIIALPICGNGIALSTCGPDIGGFLQERK
jgi:hypothetical protein